MNPKMTKLWSAGVLAGALVLNSSAASADPYVEQTVTQLAAASLVMGLGDYTLQGTPQVGKLYRDYAAVRYRVRLEAGQHYVLVGVCDADCRSLGLQIYDDNGHLVATDPGGTDVALVEVQPRWSADFEVRVDIPHCEAQRCTYGVGTYASGQSDSTAEVQRPEAPGKRKAKALNAIDI